VKSRLHSERIDTDLEINNVLTVLGHPEFVEIPLHVSRCQGNGDPSIIPELEWFDLSSEECIGKFS
jgi:hypothetical protein